MAKQPLYEGLSRIIDPVLREAGFRTDLDFLVRDFLAPGLAEHWVPMARSKHRAPMRWFRELDTGVVHSISLWRAKRNARRFGISMGVKIAEPAPDGMAKRLYPVTFDCRLDDHMGQAAYKRLQQFMDLNRPCAVDAREQVITDTLKNHVLPCLEGLSDRGSIVDWYKRPDPPPGFGYFAIPARPALGLPKYRCPAPAFDMATLGNPDIRFTDKVIRSGGVSLLNVWHSSWPQCRAGHAVLARIREITDVPLYGIAWGLKEKTAARFLQKNGNPYDICGVSPGADEAWIFNSSQRADLAGAGLPMLAVIDGEGLMIERYYDPIEAEEVEPYLLPQVEAAGQPYDWPYDWD